MTEKNEQQQVQAVLEETGGSMQYVIALRGVWELNHLTGGTKHKFRSGNLGISGKTVLRVAVEVGSTGEENGAWFELPIMTGFGNQSGNFVDIYYQWHTVTNDYSIDSEWFKNLPSVPFRIKVYYK